MKKIYLFAASVLVASSAFSQRAGTQYAKHNFGPGVMLEDGQVTFPTASEASAARGSAFWTEDFANGMASTNGTWTQAGTDQIWKHSMYTTSGEWSNGTPAPGFTSEANGFMLFDADSSNFPLSPNYVDRDGILISPSIDCSGEASVLVTFEENMRWCCSQLTINLGVSIDGGTSWTDYDVLNGLAVNAPSATPAIAQVNISAVAANEANVMLRFSWSGVSHYYWAIDDINLSPAATDDLTLLSTSYAATFELEYTEIPVAQAHQFDYSGYVKNQGANAQNNVQLNVSVDGTLTGNAYTGSSAGVVVAVGALADSLGLSGTTISAKDDYTITYDVSQTETDVNPADNGATQTFNVNDSVYTTANTSLTGNLSNQGDAYEMGPSLDIYADADATSLTFVPGTNTDAGVIAYGVLYMVDATGNFVYMDQTSDYTITASDIGSPVTVRFNTPIALTAGTTYLIVVGHYGGPDALTLATAGSGPAQTVFFLDGTDNTWYYLTTIPSVRLNMNAFVGMNDVVDNGIKLGQNTPNPTTGMTSISYEINSNANVTLEVIDLTGKKVMEVAEGNRAAGQYQINLDVNELSAGVYYYTLTAGDKRMTQKMTILK